MIALDTFALLRSIAGARETFATVEADLERAAVSSVKKVLKAKGLTLEDFRTLNRALGADTLGFILGHDAVKDSDIKGLVKKLDKHWPMLLNARIDVQRDHLLALATGAVQPVEKVVAPRSVVKKGSSKPKTAEWSKAMSAKPQKVA
jgi:hypothetical protein